MKLLLLFSLSTIGLVFSLKLGTYNTYQLFSHSNAADLLPAQIPQLLGSDIDVLCLQELNLAATVEGYSAAIKSVYPNQFSSLPSDRRRRLQNSQCTTEQIAILNGPAGQACAAYFDGSAAFAYCLATVSGAAYDAIAYSSCAGCVGIFAGVQPQLGGAYPFSLAGAVAFCSAVPPFPPFDTLDFTVYDGLLIATKAEYPIIDTFSYDLPSWLFLPRKVNVAQICVTQDGDDCTESIIFGCTHLGATGFKNDVGTPQLPSQIGDEPVTSHVGLNRLQSQRIVDELFNDNIVDNLGITDNSEVVGVFLAGDINTGQLFNRCEYDEANDGNVNADNCVLGTDDPLNPFEVFTDNGLIDAPDLRYSGGRDNQPQVLCTSCLDETSVLNDYNPLADDDFGGDSGGQFISDPATTRDLDHILVQDGYCYFRPVSLQRAFLQKYDDLIDKPSSIYDDESVPASDHYAVVLEIELRSGNPKGSKGPKGAKGSKGSKGPKGGKGAKGRGPKGSKGRKNRNRGQGKCLQSPPGYNGMMDIQNKLNEYGLNDNTNAWAISSQTVYGIFAIVVSLLIINLICLGYSNCCTQNRKRKYNKVAFTSDEEI